MWHLYSAQVTLTLTRILTLTLTLTRWRHPAAPHISPTSPLHLPYISLYLPVSPCISQVATWGDILQLHTSPLHLPYISLHLPISPCISQVATWGDILQLVVLELIRKIVRS